jgi:hypothetical protein
MAEKIVPTAEKPRVPRNTINPNGKRNGSKLRLYNKINIKIVNISMMTVKMNVAVNLARYIPHGLTGQSSNPGRVPLSVSVPKDRLSPIIPANTKDTQRIPGIICGMVFVCVSNAKLKIIRTRNEKRHIERIISLVLSSDVRSFHTIAQIF